MYHRGLFKYLTSVINFRHVKDVETHGHLKALSVIELCTFKGITPYLFT